MAWNFDGQGSKGTGVARDFIQEGNVPIYLIKQEADRIRFLTVPFDVAKIAKSKKISKDEAEELIHTDLIWKSWLMPISVWEHTIPAIPNKRYFSTQVCPGMQVCPLCAQNSIDIENGVTENKMKSFPVRKRFVVPIWSYRLKRILFFKQGQDLLEEMGVYINKNGPDIDFDVWKTGKGFNTKYKAIFLGDAEISTDDCGPVEIQPDELEWFDEEALGKKLGGIIKSSTSSPNTESREAGPEEPPTESEPSETEEPASSVKTVPMETEKTIGTTKPSMTSSGEGDPGSFSVPFGSHKGETLQELFDSGKVGMAYLKFLEERASGPAQEMAQAFLAEQAGG